ncbi:hypothetical protein BJP40_16840 [Streptomyces sp. CC53]|uniref:hypothetical protein n=1 Tax=unclassified Streptomyces TaxID=2593676 RepID=UPI0008DE0B28|nr:MULTISPECIES: hypothetical protein [unclassified Streptomyces]OII65426.1 hypothetical protein BJP40_16840 [Streptomyces sp. CC53]
MRATVWTAANQLGVAAGTPAELLTAVLSSPRRAARVVLPGDDPATAALARDLRALGRLDVTLHPAAPPGTTPDPDLSDPEAVCAADPLGVTRAYEASPGHHGGLRTAWLRSGQALVRPGQTAGGRALVLLAALPEDADPRLEPVLGGLSAGTPWEVVRTRRARVGALATRDGRPAVSEDPRTKALAYLPDGTELRLDERGRLLHTAYGPVSRLVPAVTATLATHPASALAATADDTSGPTIVTGDRMGSVHAFSLGGVHQSAPHSGRVTALAACGSRVYSGGVDGTVRLRGASAPVARRPHPVVALHAAPGGFAVAWTDGLVELHGADGGIRPFRPGPPVRAVAVHGRRGPRGSGGGSERARGAHGDAVLTVATPDTLVTLRTR